MPIGDCNSATLSNGSLCDYDAYTSMVSPCSPSSSDPLKLLPRRGTSEFNSTYCSPPSPPLNKPTSYYPGIPGIDATFPPALLFTVESLSTTSSYGHTSTSGGGCNEEAFKVDRVFGCPNEEVLYGCRLQLTQHQTDVCDGDDAYGSYEFKGRACNTGKEGCAEFETEDVSGCWEVTSEDETCVGSDGNPLLAGQFNKSQWASTPGFYCANTEGGGGWRCASDNPKRVEVPIYGNIPRVQEGMGYPQAYRTQCLTFKGRDWKVMENEGKCTKGVGEEPVEECDPKLDFDCEGSCRPSRGSLGCSSTLTTSVTRTVHNIPDKSVNASNRVALLDRDKTVGEGLEGARKVKVGGGQSR